MARHTASALVRPSGRLTFIRAGPTQRSNWHAQIQVVRLAQPSRSYNTETVSYLSHSSANRRVFLVGTAHVSSDSARDVANAIELARPDSIMVELCAGRADRLRSGSQGHHFQQLVDGLARSFFGGGSGSNFGSEFLLKAGMSGVYALLRLYGLDPGAEFKTALQEATQRKLHVCYGDRDVNETFRLLHEALSKISWASLTSPLEAPPEFRQASGVFDLAGAVEALKNRRQCTAFRSYMERAFPDVMTVMVRQRDQIMVDNLLRACPAGCIVAVVGMAHMDGIEQEWEQCGGEVFLHHDNSLRKT